MSKVRLYGTILGAASVLCSISAQAEDKHLSAPPALPAGQYAANDSHANEQVTVAAEPCEKTEACSFFRLPYLQHGFVPVRIIITNGSDKALNLEQVRIQFIAANREKIPAASEDEINRRLFSTKSAAGTKIPLVPITIHHKPVDKKISEDEDDFGFKSMRVEPHASLDGYVFYDVRELDDAPLKGAEIYVKQISAEGVGGKPPVELFGFSIPLNKWIDSRGGAAGASNTGKSAK